MKRFNNKNKRLQRQQILYSNNYHLACFFMILASFTVLFLNHYVYRYQGFNYMIKNIFDFLYAAFFLKILSRFFEKFKRFEHFADDCLRLFACFLILMLATTAVQYTPFELIDPFLFKHESLHLTRLIDWTKAHHQLYKQLAHIYNSLNYTIFLIPLLFILMRQTHQVNHFCHYIIFTGLMGFMFYFFFPSCGPVHLYDKIHFSAAQINNYQKFYEIHHGLMPSKKTGGMIACPSFHVIWAWACARFFCFNWMFFAVALSWFFAVCASTILLGWHYSLDVLTALLIISTYEIGSIWALKRSPYWFSN